MYMTNKLFTTKLNGWLSDVSPEIGLRLNELKVNQRFWEVLPSGLNRFETRLGSEAFDVDLDKRTCSCRMWQSNGYGCVHSVPAISYLNRDVEKYVDPYFCREMYMKIYQYKICPMNESKMWPLNGSKMWRETNFHLYSPRIEGCPAQKMEKKTAEVGENVKKKTGEVANGN
ncbi:unnamed protein product [Lactuca virosa]|uniref:SWIM-type domain-containing protein n=1 Tax=Lactuca virosa TaxID=75947 RepID=A0AAU9PEN2_9ASTR|nr:unnamed protein product [Lactuca virosa]